MFVTFWCVYISSSFFVCIILLHVYASICTDAVCVWRVCVFLSFCLDWQRFYHVFTSYFVWYNYVCIYIVCSCVNCISAWKSANQNQKPKDCITYMHKSVIVFLCMGMEGCGRRVRSSLHVFACRHRHVWIEEFNDLQLFPYK